LNRLDRRFEALEIRCGNTIFQLMTILEESHHSLIFMEHVPLLYEDAREMTEYISLPAKTYPLPPGTAGMSPVLRGWAKGSLNK
jgi:hypothetical protein